VKRANADKVVKVDTPDCAKETLLAKQVDSKFFINVLSGGALGSTTDYASEEMWKYDDNVVIQCK
jgi:diacylglycerol kinase family enzyme